ncbi:MAG: hypothetical protein JW976_00340 [Syntrophaceae bacterium]|nr:hypothetical protein [Syntrophaceae bacterium]
MISYLRLIKLWLAVILFLPYSAQNQSMTDSGKNKSVLIIKAAGYLEGGQPEGVDAITEATSVGRNVHEVSDVLQKELSRLGVGSEVAPFNDAKRIQEILKDSTISLIVFAGPAYSSQFPQQLKDVVPKIKERILENKIRCTSMTTCRFLGSGERTVTSFNEGLNDVGISTIDGLVIHHEYEDPDWESKVKAFAEQIQQAL